MINFGVTEKKVNELVERMERCGIKECDLMEKFVRSSGPGGQNVNKVASCVLLEHVVSGLQVKMQKARTQGLNRYYARRRLCELVENEQLGKGSPEAVKAEKIRKQKQRRKRRNRNKSCKD